MRVLGDVTEGDALDVLRQVDEIYINTIRDFGLYDKIWQAFAVFLPVRQASKFPLQTWLQCKVICAGSLKMSLHQLVAARLSAYPKND